MNGAVNGWRSHSTSSTSSGGSDRGGAGSNATGTGNDAVTAPVSEATPSEFDVKPSQPFGSLLAKWKEPGQVE